MIKAAVIGTGFMGRVHTEAIRRLGNVEVAAVAGETEDLVKPFGAQMNIARTTTDYRVIVADPEIDVVHVCTPNALHHPISRDAMQAGKHVLCEKPLATSSAEARELVEVAASTKVRNCLNYNLRSYPVVQHARRMIESGELGEILVVQGTYSQDWLLYATDWNWRIEIRDNGPLRVLADLGSHWMDMVQHLTGLPITAVCADLATFHKTRKRPKIGGKLPETEAYEEVPIATEDFGAVLLRLGTRARGAFTTSEVSCGCKNRLQIEIFGTKAGVSWNQERPDELWIGRRNTPNQVLLKDPTLLASGAKSYADLPGGHSEGYDDVHKQTFRRFYRSIEDPLAPIDYPTFEDGYGMMVILEKCLESSRAGRWIEIPPIAAQPTPFSAQARA